MIRYRCPRCKKTLTAQDDVAGAKINCPQCGQRLQVPAPPPPVNKTVLGEPDDPANRTVLGKLDDGAPPAYNPPAPAVPRTIVVETESSGDGPEELEEVNDRPRRQSRRRRDEEDDRGRRGRRGAYRPCPRCGCTDYPRQATKFGALSIVLLIIGILFWPLLLVAFFVQEKWDVCPDCGEYLRQTGTGI